MSSVETMQRPANLTPPEAGGPVTDSIGEREAVHSNMTDILAPQERVITAMITPFIDDERIDFAVAEELAVYLKEHGSDGLVLAGTTGESPTLEVEEQLDLFGAVRNAVGDDFLLIGGTGFSSTHKAVELSKRATDEGNINQLLVVSPYYNRPPQHGIVEYYQRIGRATSLPVILYNIPVRTGQEVSEDSLRRLIDDGDIHGIKDATGDDRLEVATRLKAEYGGELSLYSGNDRQNLDFARIGADGVISVASHWAGVETKAMLTAQANGDEQLADLIDEALMPSYEFETSHPDPVSKKMHDVPNPIPAKHMMAHILGKPFVSKTRSPMSADILEAHYLTKRAPQVYDELQVAFGVIRRRYA